MTFALRWYFVVFSTIILYTIEATVLCKDKYMWCKKQANLCQLDVMKKLCTKTCGCDDNNLNRSNQDACLALGCEYGCSSDVNGEAYCTCPTGYQLNDDRRTCSDFDECISNGTSLCDNDLGLACQNSPGSYSCIACQVLPQYEKYYKSDSCCQKTNKDAANECGQNSATGVKIPSARDEPLGLWPWTVLIMDGEERVLCSGVLISDQWVLAAAHCFSSMRYNASLRARVAIQSTKDEDRNEYSMETRIDQLIIHQQYVFPHNDIALLHLSTAVRTSWAARRVGLPNGETPAEDVKCWISGFETFYGRNDIVYGLVDSGIRIRKREVCDQKLGDVIITVDSDKLLCGSFEASERHACPGEYSGPIVCQRRRSCQWYVAGLMAVGDMCSPGLESSHQSLTGFISVDSYEEWIMQNTGIKIVRDGTDSCAST